MQFKTVIFLAVIFSMPVFAAAQTRVEARRPAATHEPVGDIPKLPSLAVKTNLLYDATTTMNLGVEFRVSKSLTIDVPVNYNPWAFSGNSKIKHVMVQPELHYWIREPFNGHFLGVNLQYAFYNVGNLPLAPGFREAMGYGDLANFRYQGSLYGAGISYGYHWMLARRLSLEATIGMGYAWLDYEKYRCETCGDLVARESRHYFGPTKVGLSLTYIIK